MANSSSLLKHLWRCDEEEGFLKGLDESMQEESDLFMCPADTF